MVRPNSHEVWLEVAKAISKRSRCDRSQVGCVIVDTSGRVVATGYNGPPANWMPKRDDGSLNLDAMTGTCGLWCPRAMSAAGTTGYDNCPSVHAEMNALMVSDRTRRENGIMYVTRAPCYHCAKAVANSGIKTLYAGPVPSHYPESIYRDVLLGEELMINSAINVVRFDWKT